MLAASDAQALGVLEAFEAAGLPRPWPLVAGIGGDLEAVRRVVGGDQTFTVHMPVTQTAQRAADVALSLASAEQGADLVDSHRRVGRAGVRLRAGGGVGGLGDRHRRA